MNHHLFYREEGKKGIIFAMDHPEEFENNPLYTPVMPDATDVDLEKHIPALKYRNNKLSVRIGTRPHPYESEHHIEWIFVKTKTGGLIHYFKPTDIPKAKFKVDQEEIEAVYVYCNIHGLWVNGKTAHTCDTKCNPEKDIEDEMVCSAEFTEGCKEAWDDIK